MKEALESIRSAVRQQLESVKDLKELDNIRVKYLGKKGELTAILKQMGKLSAEERPVIGQLANEVRSDLEHFLENTSEKIKSQLQDAKLAAETIDVTMPGRTAPMGCIGRGKGYLFGDGLLSSYRPGSRKRLL